MTTLIDALKGLHKRMDECAEQEVGCFADLLLEIIAEHERSGGTKAIDRWDLVDSNPMGYEPNRVMQKDATGEWVLWEDVEKHL